MGEILRGFTRALGTLIIIVTGSIAAAFIISLIN